MDGFEDKPTKSVIRNGTGTSSLKHPFLCGNKIAENQHDTFSSMLASTFADGNPHGKFATLRVVIRNTKIHFGATSW